MKSSGVSEVFFPFPPFLNVNSLRDTIVASCVTKKCLKKCKNETRYNKETTFEKICRNK